MDERNKKIAKNTLLLYIRTFISLIIGLYTGRVMLHALGIDNYGIQNVVGGIVGFSVIITGSLSAACSRFITFGLGKGDLSWSKTIFSMTVNVQFIIGIIVVIALEILGVAFLNSEANIPPDRMNAANWVLQLSIISTFVSLLVVPFSASIIGHEDMSIYAYLSIVETVLKLIITITIDHYAGDRLILLSFLNLAVSIGVSIFYICYCKYKFKEVDYILKLDRDILKKMLGYSGWSFLNNSSWIFGTQGVSMLINVFFGVAYNAARGVASTVNGTIQAFVGNFSVSFRPQITKSYAAGDFSYCYSLVNRGGKITWLLMLVFIVPVFIESDALLSLWLGEVPPMASLFLKFTLFETLAVQSGQTLFMLIQAHGNIRQYSIMAALYTLIIFPLTWLAFRYGAPVWSPYLIFIFVFFTINAIRLYELSKLTTYKWQSFFASVLIPCVSATIISFIIPVLITFIWAPSLLRFFVLVPICIISALLSCYYVGLTRTEKEICIIKIKELYHSRIRPAFIRT